MKFNFTRFPAILTNKVEEVEYNLEVFGELKLSWGIELFIYRITFATGDNIGIGDIRLLPKEEFCRYFDEFTEIPRSDLQ